MDKLHVSYKVCICGIYDIRLPYPIYRTLELDRHIIHYNYALLHVVHMYFILENIFRELKISKNPK